MLWDGLPAEIRKQLEDAVEQTTQYANQIAQAENDKALASLRKAGRTEIYVPTAEERRAFKKALVPVHRKMESRIGREIIADVYKATGFDPDSI